MQRTSFADMACSLARTLDVAGEWWTPLIVRDVWMGRRRFDEIQRNLEISRKVLTNRLDTLVSEDILERRRYQESPPRDEYVLTEKGMELMTALFGLLAWGDRWLSVDDGPPVLLRHRACGEVVRPDVRCPACDQTLRADEVWVEPGPGARIGWGTRVPEWLAARGAAAGSNS